MPQRFLRPGLTNSSRYNAGSFAAQSAYIRIMTRVDDFGQYDGRPAVILGDCFSIWNAINPTKSVNLKQLVEMLQELITVKLVEFWEGDDGKFYLQITQWQERIRVGCVPKWKLEGTKYTLIETITERTGTGQTKMRLVEERESREPEALEIWEAYPRKEAKPTAIRAILTAIDRFPFADVLAKTKLYAECRAGQDPQFTPLPATWFNQERFNDDPVLWRKPIGNGNGHSSPRQIWQIKDAIATVENRLNEIRRGFGQSQNGEDRWEPPLTDKQKAVVKAQKDKLKTLQAELDAAPV